MTGRRQLHRAAIRPAPVLLEPSVLTSTPGYVLYAAWSEARGKTSLRNAAIAALHAAALFVLVLLAPRVHDRGSAPIVFRWRGFLPRGG